MCHRWRNFYSGWNRGFLDLHVNGDIQEIRAWKIELEKQKKNTIKYKSLMINELIFRNFSDKNSDSRSEYCVDKKLIKSDNW